MEQSVIQYGRTRIPYVIRRSAARGTVAIAVEPSGEVVLTAPTTVPLERLDRVVHEKARWIVERWNQKRSVRSTPPHEFITGETFHYLGRQYRLRVRSGHGEVQLHRGWLNVSAPATEHVRTLLVGWYRAHAVRRLPERVETWASKLGFDVPQVLIRDQRKRWGSCDQTGVLRFNWRVMQAPMQLLDYVVAHEAVHLIYRDHGPRFWATVGRIMPDYETRRVALARLGPGWDW